MNQERPVLPTPHQVVGGLWDGLTGQAITSKKSLVYHAWITLSGTLLGFGIGTGLGVLLAVGIVYNRAMDMSVMPWAIASQMVPIIALAPMISVVMNAVGASALVTKAMISAYLSFFPVVVGMVKGLRSPDADAVGPVAHLRCGGRGGVWASCGCRPRCPISSPALKVGIAAALVGAIVGELPTCRPGWARGCLQGSYYGQTVQIWAALFRSAMLAAGLVMAAGWIEGRVLQRMGMVR